MRGLGLRRSGAWTFSWMLLQTFENCFLVGGNFFRRVAKCPRNLRGLRRTLRGDGFERKRAAVILARVVWIFQNVAGQDRDYGFARVNFVCGGERADARYRGGRCGFAADAIAADDGFGVGDFLLADGDDAAVGAQDSAQGFLPGNGRANFYGGGEGTRICNRRDFVWKRGVRGDFVWL